MNTPDLFTPVRLGAIEAPNRIVMAPLTRMRAGPGRVPTPLMAEYYAQRAAAGLIVSEATAISQQGTGCPNSPGIYTQEQIAGWQKVTEAVEEFFCSFGTWVASRIRVFNRMADCRSRPAPLLREPVRCLRRVECSLTSRRAP